MKKILCTALLALVMAILVSGCSTKRQSSAGTPVPAHAQAQPTLAEAQGLLRVGMSFDEFNKELRAKFGVSPIPMISSMTMHYYFADGTLSIPLSDGATIRSWRITKGE